MASIFWHSGFYGGMELEFIKYKNSLIFEIEHSLSKEPLRLDMLIIKKNLDVEIKNQIGVIFRKYNIIEYKSPDDGMTIDDYFKTIGYACLYKGLGKTVDKIPFDEITVTLCRNVYPRELIKSIKKYGGKIEKQYSGIYYVRGLIEIPSQIIVTGELEGSEHSALKILSRNAREKDVRQFLNYSKGYLTPEDRNNVNAVLQVSTVSNVSLYNWIRRDSSMCQALMELMKDEVDEKIDAVVLQNIRNVMNSMNISAEQAMDAMGISEEKRIVYASELE